MFGYSLVVRFRRPKCRYHKSGSPGSLMNSHRLGHHVTFSCIASNQARPLWVSRYFCSRLVGLPGMVNSMSPLAIILRTRSFRYRVGFGFPSLFAISFFPNSFSRRSFRIKIAISDSTPNSTPDSTPDLTSRPACPCPRLRL